MLFVSINLEEISEKSTKQGKSEALKLALQRAIERCIEEDVLRDFFVKRGLEVIKTMYFGHTWEERIELAENAALERGEKNGVKKGLRKGFKKGLELNRVNSLGNLMRASGRQEEFMDSLSDPEMQQKLFTEFGIEM